MLHLVGIPELSLTDSLLSVAASALFTYVIFNRFEPMAMPILIFFLVVIPSALSLLLWSHFSLLLAVGTAFSLYHSIILISVTLYRLSPFHPLARYPGPAKAKVASYFYYKLGAAGKRHEEVKRWFEEYNADVVRIGPNEIAIRDPSTVPAIMGTQGLARGPGHDGRGFFADNRNLLNWRDPIMHAKRRKPWARGLNPVSLKQFEPVLEARVTQLVDLLLSKNDGRANISECISHFAYDFMGDMAFGGGSELMKNGDPQRTIESMQASMKVGILLESFPWFSYHALKIPSVYARIMAFRKAAEVRARQRIMKGTQVKDLFHFLNHEDLGGDDAPSINTVASEGFLVVLAGADTTSATIATTLWCLMRHPAVYKKLQEEVDRFYPQGENALDCKHHGELTYLDAVLNETLRLYPVEASGSQRATTGQGLLIGPHYIPPYTSVRIHTYAMQRDPRNFSPHPESFWPERWLIASSPSIEGQSEKSEGTFIHNTNAFMPFSFGPANCVGKALAIKEMKMVMCHLLQQMDVRFAEGYDPEQFERGMRDWLTLEVGSLPVVITPRSAKV
ncbi:cytochrome P450 [Cristinia sonorae]|uniref:Cytochrome P450 n=1 Tax=Cristinia sonorae TaxID=1940300 RepID=A0A8K0XLR3_9AGAR|nr:cytochrome P450 [Cristinia sonorae]